jgi:hypothetical protein
MKMVDLGWAAGFMEGECSFSISNGKFRTPLLSCPQKGTEPLERLHKLFPLNGTVHKRGGREMYVWSVAGAYAVAIMFTVYLLMSKRRQGQIRNAIAHWKTTRPKLPKGLGWRVKRRRA